MRILCYNLSSCYTAESCDLKHNQNTLVEKCVSFYKYRIFKFKRNKDIKKPNVLMLFHVCSYLFGRTYFSVFYVFVFLKILRRSNFY
jgi:hypothetical protein